MSYLPKHQREKSMVFHYIYLVLSIVGLIVGGLGLVGVIILISTLSQQLMVLSATLDSLTLIITFIGSLLTLIDYLMLVFVVVGLIFWKKWLPSLVHVRMLLTCWINGGTFLFTIFQYYQAKFFETQPLETIYALLISGAKVFIICGVYWLVDLYYQDREDYFTK